ncbi:MAG: hypothetical protein PHY05_02355 [Methanothrix sp.]|nr:hypothetical protein [Methanothrix sp.]
MAALLQEVTGGGPGDRLRDRDAGTARAGLNDPRRTTYCGRCAGGPSRRGSCCASCTPGLQRIGPGMDIGVDLGEEWRMAERLNEADS